MQEGSLGPECLGELLRGESLVTEALLKGPSELFEELAGGSGLRGGGTKKELRSVSRRHGVHTQITIRYWFSYENSPPHWLLSDGCVRLGKLFFRREYSSHVIVLNSNTFSLLASLNSSGKKRGRSKRKERSEKSQGEFSGRTRRADRREGLSEEGTTYLCQREGEGCQGYLHAFPVFALAWCRVSL